MSISPSVAALVLGIVGALSVGQAEAARVGTGTFDNTPGFLKRAEEALERGQLDRVVGLIVPRMRRLHRTTHKHLAHSTLCSAQLRLENLAMAEEACTLAAQSKHANWSDLNNLGVYHYAIGDFDTALTWFERSAQMDPKREDVRVNIEAALVASER